MLEKRPLLTRDDAERIAIGGLAYLAERPEALSRFLALAGIGPTTLRSAAADPNFLAGVIDHFLGNDALLADYAETAGFSPAQMAEVRRLLASP